MTSRPEYPRDAGTPVSHLPFSPAVRVGGLVFVSGQASVDAKGAIVPDTFAAEVTRSMENLRAVLATAGSDLKHVVQVRAYVRDPANLAAYNELYRQFFQEPFPARTTLTGCLPPTLQFEIECVALSAAAE